jgi:hypothetical protein
MPHGVPAPLHPTGFQRCVRFHIIKKKEEEA